METQRDHSPKRPDLLRSQVEALFNTTVEILQRCEPGLVVSSITLENGKASLLYVLGYFSNWSAFLGMLSFPSHGIVHKMPGFSWPRLVQLLELGVPLALVKRKLEDLQVEAGKFEASHAGPPVDWMVAAPDEVLVEGDMRGTVHIDRPDPALARLILLLQNPTSGWQPNHQYERLMRVLFDSMEPFQLSNHFPSKGAFGYCASGDSYRAVVLRERFWAVIYYRCDTGELLVGDLQRTEFPQLEANAWWTHFGLCASPPPLQQLQQALAQNQVEYVQIADGAALNGFWKELLGLAELCVPNVD